MSSPRDQFFAERGVFQGIDLYFNDGLHLSALSLIFSIDNLKHAIATHLLDAGADIMFVKDWLGHKNSQNTIVYSQLTSRTRDEQAGRIFASPKII